MREDAFRVVDCGVDDITVGFEVAGSEAASRLNALPGLPSRRGKMLGERTERGDFAHRLGRSVCFWRPETSRLYVQAKFAPYDWMLCSFGSLRGSAEELVERLTLTAEVSLETAWVTRMDVAVDAVCDPVDGKVLLDGLEASRPPNGWRTHSVGSPRSTVYFRARGSEDVKARAYCRNLKTKGGEPFGRIRLEAEQRFEPLAVTVNEALDPPFPSKIWLSRYGSVDGTIRRLARESQVIEMAQLVEWGVLTYAQGERMSMFLDLERLGVTDYYPQSVRASRRREAKALGLASNDSGTPDVVIELEALLAPYRKAVVGAALETAKAPAREGAAARAVALPADALVSSSNPSPLPTLPGVTYEPDREPAQRVGRRK